MKGWSRSVSLSDWEDGEVEGGQASVLERLIKNERCVELPKAIETLESPRDQAVLRMSYFESMSPAAIASALECPVDRVYVVKLRAVRRLQRCWKE